MAKQTPQSDDALVRSLSVYAGMVEQVLADPARWLGSDEDPPPDAGPSRKLLDRARDSLVGDTTPSSPAWTDLPLERRIDWWLRRIEVTAGLAAAAPRFAGLVADRLPLRSALGASASGLAVCAVAREHGIVAADDWVPLLAKVLFDRDVSSAPAVPTAQESRQALEQAGEDETEPPGGMASLRNRSQRGVRALWRLATNLLELQKTLDTRPRGGVLTRTIAKVPVIGVAGGWLDERSGIRKAAKATSRHLGAASPPR